MSNQINDGGPAIPMAWNGQRSHEGISIRDYFAAVALQGMNIDGKFLAKTYAADAYKMADAMLKAREAK